VTLPEVVAAQRGGWGRMAAPVGERIDAVDKIVSLSPQPAEIDYDTQIPVEGLFRAIVSVKKLSAEPDADGQGYINPFQVVEAWFYIDSNGGRTSEHLDSSLMPDSIQPLPGPARRKRGRLGNTTSTNVQGSPLAIAAAKSPSHQPSRTIEPDGNRHLLYFNIDSNTYQPASGVSVYTQICESISGQCYAPSWDTTDGNGRYWARCPGGNGEYYIDGQYQLNGGSFELVSNIIGGFSDDNFSCQEDGGDTGLGSNDSFLIFYEMTDVIASSRSVFAPFSRGGIRIELLTDGHIISKYEPDYDDILIQTGTANRAVGAAYGLFTLAHEYGHALQNASLGGIPWHSCPSPHFVNVAEDVTCAYTEGFANYHAAATEATKFGLLSGGGFWVAETTTDQARIDAGVSDAEGVEGSVSALLYSMSSSTGLALPAHYVADLSNSCWFTWTVYGGVIHPNGADLIVWCAQGTLSGDDQTKLSSRNRSVATFNGGPAQPANFNAATFRSDWHQRLLGIP
jgi:hypothetical protein